MTTDGCMGYNRPGSGAGSPIIGGGDQEKPWDYHDMHRLYDLANNGMPSQRCVQALDDGRSLVLWHPQRDASEVVYLTVSHHVPEKHKNSEYIVSLSMEDTELGETVFPMPSDFCLVTESGIAGEMIHIVFVARSPEGSICVYDATLPSANLPYPMAGVKLEIKLQARIVNQHLIAPSNPCSMPSASTQPNLVNGPGIVVVWAQDQTPGGGGPTDIMSNVYNPTIPGYVAGTVMMVNEHMDEDGCSYPTVECTGINNHVSWIHQDRGAMWRLYYAYQTASGITPWIYTSDGTPVDSFGGYHLNAGGIYAPTMVVYNNNGVEEILVAIKNEAEPVFNLFVFKFTSDIVAGPPTIFAEEIPDVFDIMRAGNGFLGTSQSDCYQLGISNIEGSMAIAFIYKTTEAGEQQQDFNMLAKLWSEIQGAVGTVDEAWNLTELHSAIINLAVDAEGEGATFKTQVHYSYNYNVRPWQSQDGEAWFPINIFRKSIIIGFFTGEEWYTYPTPVMIMKDIPLYTNPM